MERRAQSLTATIPDLRDGLTDLDRRILIEHLRLERERPGRAVASWQLYGRVVEFIDVDPRAFQRALVRLAGR